MSNTNNLRLTQISYKQLNLANLTLSIVGLLSLLPLFNLDTHGSLLMSSLVLSVSINCVAGLISPQTQFLQHFLFALTILITLLAWLSLANLSYTLGSPNHPTLTWYEYFSTDHIDIAVWANQLQHIEIAILSLSLICLIAISLTALIKNP